MGVGSRATFDRTNAAIEAAEFEPVIDRTIGFAEDEVREAYRYVDAGEHQGRSSSRSSSVRGPFRRRVSPSRRYSPSPSPSTSDRRERNSR